MPPPGVAVRSRARNSSRKVMSGMIATGIGPNRVVSALVRLSATVPVPHGLTQRTRLPLKLRGPVEHEVGEEGVEVTEVPVQNPFGAARLVGDGPAGQPVRAVPQKHAFGSAEQLLPRVAKVHPGRHSEILSCVSLLASVAQWAHAH